jgi:hypothetical protein
MLITPTVCSTGVTFPVPRVGSAIGPSVVSRLSAAIRASVLRPMRCMTGLVSGSTKRRPSPV